jgi:hypothetical protein
LIARAVVVRSLRRRNAAAQLGSNVLHVLPERGAHTTGAPYTGAFLFGWHIFCGFFEFWPPFFVWAAVFLRPRGRKSAKSGEVWRSAAEFWAETRRKSGRAAENLSKPAKFGGKLPKFGQKPAELFENPGRAAENLQSPAKFGGRRPNFGRKRAENQAARPKT